jgi:multicomponent Na+:H+ antiporter subunit D
MNWLVPLPVAIPLIGAALITATDHVLPRAAKDVIGILCAAATFAFGIVLCFESGRHELVHWFGGWEPRGGLAIGIAFNVDPLGSAMCALAGAVVLLALLYSLTFMKEAAHFFDALVLVICAALCGFALSADLFNLFVWLELAGVAAFALTGFEIRKIGPLQGAVNFAIVNTLGGYFVLISVALLYGRTGALNLAQIGRSLAHGGADGLVIVALTLVTAGFLCKAAVVPFHFWLADAYAVAPTPVCALFAGAMTDIGLLGVARVYWTAFSGAVGTDGGDLLLALGVVTSVVGGVMAFLQRHLKRMLAYSVVCHIGVMLAGIGLVSVKGLAGAAVMLVAHGLATAGLFFAAGLLLARERSVDELALRRRGRGRRVLAALWFAGAVSLAGPPYIGTFLGHSLIDDAAVAAGRRWVLPFIWLAGACASAALLRAGARIFLGWGGDADPLLTRGPEERPPPRGSRTGLTTSVCAAAIVCGLVVSLVPGLGQRAEAAASQFENRVAYAAVVLDSRPVAREPRPPVALEPSSTTTLLYSSAAVLFALALAGFGLRPHRAPCPVAALKAVHSGVIGDYVAWLTVGTAMIGGVWALMLR